METTAARRPDRDYLYETPVPRHASECPVEDWLAFLGHRWNATILWHLWAGPKRHGALMACLPGITAKVLAERLEGLRQRQLILRSEQSTFPRTVVYRLSARGEAVVDIIGRLEPWAASIAAHSMPTR